MGIKSRIFDTKQMKRKLSQLLLLTYGIFLSPLSAGDYSFFLEHDYFQSQFIIETWASLGADGEGGGARLIENSVHRQPSLGVRYRRSQLELGLRLTPRTISQSARMEDIDFSCYACRRHGPPIDLKNWTIRDRMERNNIRPNDVWSHSYTDDASISYSAAELTLAYFPYAQGEKNLGLFFRGILRESKNTSKDYNPMNPKYTGTFEPLPGLVATMKKRYRTLEAATGYRKALLERLTLEAEVGIMGGRDVFDLEYRYRWLDMKLFGLGSGFFWSSTLNLELSEGFNAFIKAGQKHYFGELEKVYGIYPSIELQMPLLINSTISGYTYGMRISQLQMGVSYGW